MSNRTEWGHIAHALCILHPRDRVADELRPDDPDAITASFVVGIWTENGDGIALEGDRRELLAFATALTAVSNAKPPRYPPYRTRWPTYTHCGSAAAPRSTATTSPK